MLVPGQEEPLEDPKPKARATRQRATTKPKAAALDEGDLDVADVAVALEEPGEPVDSAEDGAVDSKPRRRGRRGGRRRSASKAADTSSSD